MRQKQVGHIMAPVGSIAVHVNAAEEYTRKNSEPRKNRSIVKANTREMKHRKSSTDF